MSLEFREELILAAARFQGTKRNNLGLARQWLDASNPGRARINRVCTEAILLFSEGRIDEALTRVADGEKLVARLPPSELRAAQEKAWEQLRDIFEREARARQDAAIDTHPSDAQP